jgi:hypothetical protein
MPVTVISDAITNSKAALAAPRVEAVNGKTVLHDDGLPDSQIVCYTCVYGVSSRTHGPSSPPFSWLTCIKEDPNGVQDVVVDSLTIDCLLNATTGLTKTGVTA